MRILSDTTKTSIKTDIDIFIYKIRCKLDKKYKKEMDELWHKTIATPYSHLSHKSAISLEEKD